MKVLEPGAEAMENPHPDESRRSTDFARGMRWAATILRDVDIGQDASGDALLHKAAARIDTESEQYESDFAVKMRGIVEAHRREMDAILEKHRADVRAMGIPVVMSPTMPEGTMALVHTADPEKWSHTTAEDVAAFDLPTLCLSLRMARNGAGDPWPPEKVALARAHIESRLATWRLPESAFDEAVRLMCEATLAETA